MPSLRIDAIDPIIWEWVKEILLNPQRLLEAWKLHEKRQLDELQPLVNMIETNKNKLENLKIEKKRLIKAYTAGALTLDDIAEEKMRIKKQIMDLNLANEELRADMQPRIINPEEIETLEAYAQNIREGADWTSNDPAEQREIYRRLQMEISLSYEATDETNNEVCHWAELHCVLGEDLFVNNVHYKSPK